MLEHVQRVAADKGKHVPHDLVDFMAIADVVLLDAAGNRIETARVIVTWED